MLCELIQNAASVTVTMGMLFLTKWILLKHPTQKFNRKIAKRFSHAHGKGVFPETGTFEFQLSFVVRWRLSAMNFKLELSITPQFVLISARRFFNEEIIFICFNSSDSLDRRQLRRGL